MQVTAIIAAGGRGTRFGGGRLKQLLSVGGRAVLDRSVAVYANHPAVAEVIVALPEELVSDPPAYLRAGSVRVVGGGVRRQDSVANAFRAASAASDVFVIHDAARPFASRDLITRTIAAAAESGAAVAALQSRDTVKKTMWQENFAVVAETLPRESIFLAQTPQAFRREVLGAALAQAVRDGVDATDEAGLAERAGFTVRLVPGETTNIKITTAADIVIAEAIAGSHEQPAVDGRQSAIRNPQSALSVGSGYDLHRLVEGRPLVVAGVTLASSFGALGHSDADVVCHAIVDALLGAASLGDIGSHFPDSDPRWKGASGVDLIARAVAALRDAGYGVANVDATVILESPRIRDHVDAMRRTVAAALGIDVGCVSVKGKTNEGVDAVGRGEAIAAHAVALLRTTSDF